MNVADRMEYVTPWEFGRYFDTEERIERGAWHGVWVRVPYDPFMAPPSSRPMMPVRLEDMRAHPDPRVRALADTAEMALKRRDNA